MVLKSTWDMFEFIFGKKGSETLFKIMESNDDIMQQEGKALEHIQEAIVILRQFDSPQATLKQCLKDMFKDFLDFVTDYYIKIDKSTGNFNDGEEKLNCWLELHYSEIFNGILKHDNIFNNIADFKKYETTAGKTIDDLLTEYKSTNDSNGLKTFHVANEKHNDTKRISEKFTKSFREEYNTNLNAQITLKDLFKTFFENKKLNEYSTLNSILHTINPNEKKKVEDLLKNLFAHLYGNADLIKVEKLIFVNDPNFDANVNALYTTDIEFIKKWCSDNFSQFYYAINEEQKKKIKLLLGNVDEIVIYNFTDINDVLTETGGTQVKLNCRQFFDYFFNLIDIDTDKAINIENIDSVSNIRLNIKKLTNSDFYLLLINLAHNMAHLTNVINNQSLKKTIKNQNGGIFSKRYETYIDELRKSLITDNKIILNRVAFKEQVYFLYDVFINFLIDYEPDNLIKNFLKSSYSVSGKQYNDCSKEFKNVVLSHIVPPYIPNGGNAINHGALIQGIMEQLGGNNLAYDMYLSDTTLQLHNNELEHSVMSDIMRGGNANLDPSLFRTMEGKIYFNDRDSINDLYCRLVDLLKKFNLSQGTIDKIEVLFKENMIASNQIKKLIGILKAADGLSSISPTEENEYFIKSVTGNKQEYDDIIKKIEQLKNQQNANTTTAQNATSMLNIIHAAKSMLNPSSSP